MATKYVSPAGSDGNPGSIGSPFLTVNHGVTQVGPGDELLLRENTYVESLIYCIPPGTSWSNTVRIAAYPGESVSLRPTSGPHVVAIAGTSGYGSVGTSQYIEFDNVHLDGRGGIDGDPLRIESGPGYDAHHCRFQNLTIYGNPAPAMTGMYPGQCQVILVTSAQNNSLGGHQFLNLVVTGGPTPPSLNVDFTSMIYLQQPDCIVDGCVIENGIGSGVQMYNGHNPGTMPDRTIVRNCLIRNFTRGPTTRHFGIIAARGVDHQFLNNIIYGLAGTGGGSAGLIVYNASGVYAAHNTVYGNAKYGILLDVGAINTTLQNNISNGNGLSNYTDSGTGTVLITNMFSGNPLFVDAPGGDFHLQGASPAVNAGLDVLDFDGDSNTSEPSDIGAHPDEVAEGSIGGGGVGGSPSGEDPPVSEDPPEEETEGQSQTGGTRKVFPGRPTGFLGAGLAFISPTSPVWFDSDFAHPWSVAGSFLNLKIALSVAPGGATSRTFTLLINGVASALAVTIAGSATTGTDTVNAVSVSPGDTLQIRHAISGSPATTEVQHSIEFDSTNARESGHGGRNVTTLTGSGVTYTNPLTHCMWGGDPATLLASSEAVIPCAGSFTRCDINLATAPGSGQSRTFVIIKNGVVQDGSGGTVNTTMVIANTAKTVTGTFSLPVVADDEITLRQTPTAAPTNSGFTGISMAFLANVDGESIISCANETNASASTPNYITWPGDVAWFVTEPPFPMPGPLTTVTLSDLYIKFSDLSQRNLGLRKNGADTLLEATTTGTDAVKVHDSADSVTLTNADTWSIRTTQITGGFRRIIWSMKMFVPPPVKIQYVTQFVQEVACDEDVERDPPADLVECIGGGTVAASTNPAGGTALATATAPLAWMELTLNDGSPATVYRWSKDGIPHGAPKQARVLEFGTVTLALTDLDGGVEAATISTLLSDIDGTLRALWVSDTIRQARVDYYIADLATLKASGTPWRIFRGFVSDCTPEGDRQFRITSDDTFTARFSGIDGEDLQVPTQLIEDKLAVLGAGEEMFDKPSPHLYGSITAEGGAWECPYVGTAVPVNQPSVGELYWFQVGIGVVRVREVFLANLSDATPNQRIQIPESGLGSYIKVPGRIGFVDFPLAWSIRNGRRYTLIGGLPGSPAVRLAKENRIPLVVNVCGYDTVGNGTEATITSPPLCLAHFINNYISQDTTADWLPIDEEGGISLLDTDTFAIVDDLMGQLSYVCAGAVGGDYTQQSWRDRVAEFCRSFGYDFGINRHGQGILTYLDRVNLHSGLAAFTPAEILEHSVQFVGRLPVENQIRYVHTRNYLSSLPDLTPVQNSRLPLDPFAGDWLSGLQLVENTASITALGGGTKGLRRSDVQEYSMVRDAYTADSVAIERRDLLSVPNGRIEASFGLTLKQGYALQLGDLITAEHWDLPWTGSRRCQVRRLATDLDAFTVRPTIRDIEDLLP